MSEGLDTFSDQHVRFDADFVSTGHWAELWWADRGPCVALLPVLALRGWGYAARGGFIRLDDLAYFSGTSGVRRALVGLAGLGAIELLKDPAGTFVNYRLAPGLVQRRANGPRFVFPGRIVGRLVWAGLTPSARAVLVALAGALRPRVWRGDDFEWESSEEFGWHFADWIRGLDAFDVREENDGLDCILVRRVGRVTVERLAERSGVGAAAVRRALCVLSDRSAHPPLVELLEHGNAYVAHLPERWWGA